jgi:hypothetical protein
MGDRQGAYKVLVGRLEGKRPPGRPTCKQEGLIKMIFKRWDGKTCIFFYPGKIGFVGQRILQTSKDSSGLQTALGQKKGPRLGSMGLAYGSSFL